MLMPIQMPTHEGVASIFEIPPNGRSNKSKCNHNNSGNKHQLKKTVLLFLLI